MSDKWGKTISTKLPKDVTDRYQETLDRNGHSSGKIIAAAIMAYLYKYEDNDDFNEFITNIDLSHNNLKK